MIFERFESVLDGLPQIPSLFKESGGAIALPLLLGLFLFAELWRRKTQAPAWPHVLLPALLVPPVLLIALGGIWILRNGTWRVLVLLGLGLSELPLSIACVRAARRRWPIILCIVSVAWLWTFYSWIGAALSVGGDTL